MKRDLPLPLEPTMKECLSNSNSLKCQNGIEVVKKALEDLLTPQEDMVIGEMPQVWLSEAGFREPSSLVQRETIAEFYRSQCPVLDQVMQTIEQQNLMR